MVCSLLSGALTLSTIPLAPFRVRKGKKLYLRDTLRLPAIPTDRDCTPHFSSACYATQKMRPTLITQVGIGSRRALSLYVRKVTTIAISAPETMSSG